MVKEGLPKHSSVLSSTVFSLSLSLEGATRHNPVGLKWKEKSILIIKESYAIESK